MMQNYLLSQSEKWRGVLQTMHHQICIAIICIVSDPWFGASAKFQLNIQKLGMFV